MKRQLHTWVLALLISVTSIMQVTQAEDFVEGIDYTFLPSPFPTSSEAGKVEVIEIFWYGCPHCFTLEPVINNWQRPAHIDFRLMPAISKKGWAATGARTFYTATALGILDKVHTDLFKEIHEQKNRALISDPEAVARFFEKYGVTEEQFYNAWNSFSVDSQLKQASNIFARSGITGVPSLIVNGKYLTGPSQAGGSERMLRVVEHLATLELGK